MDTLRLDFGDIAAGLFVSSLGLIAVVISLFRLRRKDFSLLNFGLFCSLNGIRWLVETPTMKTLVGFPFTFPYFHGLLTYALVIPFSAFLVDIFGRGLYDSMRWVFRSTIVYTVAAIAYDLVRPGPLSDVSINSTLVVLWCFVWIVNVLFVGKERDAELRVLRIVFLTTLVSVAIDNLVKRSALPWEYTSSTQAFLCCVSAWDMSQCTTSFPTKENCWPSNRKSKSPGGSSMPTSLSISVLPVASRSRQSMLPCRQSREISTISRSKKKPGWVS